MAGSPPQVPVLSSRQLAIGPLLAEGGEGQVYELVGRPDQVYKAYRVPPPIGPLAELVGWASGLRERAPALTGRVAASTAWPVAVVTGSGPGHPAGTAAGLVLPRAPRRYSVRHKDGQPHLATLSYLTADPAQRAASYGISLPPAMSAERLGLVYALARLLEAFEWDDPAMGHGDLSAKNVLWSLTRGPEVFVLDCDNGEPWLRRGGGGAAGGGTPGGAGTVRRRAMTPNWDDPAVPAGSNPTPASDRYSLALIFLRVAGGAHFPIQKRQKEGEDIVLDVDVPGPARRLDTLGPGAPVWALCSAGLSATDPGRRPPASAWVEALHAIIVELGASRVIDAVGAAQGRAPVPAVAPASVGAVTQAAVTQAAMTQAAVTRATVGEQGAVARGTVVVRPVTAAIRTRREVRRTPLAVGAPSGPAAAATAATPTWSTTRTRTGGIVTTGQVTAAGVPATGAGRVVPRPVATVAWTTQVRRALRAFVRWLVTEHRRTWRALRTPGRRARGIVRIPWCAAVDFLVAAVSFFVVAMVVSPFLGV